MCLFCQILGGMANSVAPDQTIPIGSAFFARHFVRKVVEQKFRTITILTIWWGFKA